MAQFPTVRGFLCGSPWLLRDLYGAVPNCREIYMRQSTATQQFVMAQFPTVGRFILWLLSNLYGAVPDCREIYIGQVHSYSATYMAQFPTVRGFLWGGPQLLSNLYGAVPDCREIYTMATQQFVWRSSRLSGDLYRASPQLLSNLHGAVPDCQGISMGRSTAT